MQGIVDELNLVGIETEQSPAEEVSCDYDKFTAMNPNGIDAVVRNM